MFDWFKKLSYTNTLPFPKTEIPKIEPPKQEQEQYSIGVTNENRMTLRIGYTTLTMSREGCRQIIEQLTVFMNQLPESTDD